MDPFLVRPKTSVEQVSGLPLWAEPAPPPIPHGTRRRAYQRAMRDAPSKKAILLSAIEEAGPRGLTRAEASQATGIGKDTVNGRAYDLIRGCHVRETGERNGQKVLIAWPGR